MIFKIVLSLLQLKNQKTPKVFKIKGHHLSYKNSKIILEIDWDIINLNKNI